MNDTKKQTLIEHFDTKTSTHIGSMVAITFGAFTVLTFLQGKGSQLDNLSVQILLIIETVAFPFGIFYCLSRALYYARAAEVTKKGKLVEMETAASKKYLEHMPRLMKELVRLRQKLKIRYLAWIVPLGWGLWLIVILAVLFL